jgi:AcrR family transcriptional regulator
MARTPKVVEDRREQILDAAMHVFAEKGFARATNKDIARRAGITPGLIYHYFESKEALLMTIVESRSPLKIEGTFSPDMLALPPETLFRAIVMRVLSIVETEDFIAFARMLIPEILNNEADLHAQFAPAVIRRILGFLSRCIEAKIASGEFRPIEAENMSFYAQSLFGSLVTCVLRRAVLHDAAALAYTQEQVADIVVDMFLHGLVAR